MRRTPLARRLIFDAALLGLAIVAVPAGGGEPDDRVRLKSASLPVPFRTAEGAVDRTLEASAVEIVGDGRLLLIGHDKSLPLFVVEASTGRIVGPRLSCARFAELAKLGAKWEASARDDQGNYYFVGSKPGDATTPNVTRLVRFRLDGDGSAERPLVVRDDSVESWDLTPSLSDVLRREGADPATLLRLSAEGLEVMTTPRGRNEPPRREVLLGMRRPDDMLRVYAVDMATLDGPGPVGPARRFFAFRSAGREGCPEQIRSLVRVPAWGGFLVSTGTEDEFNAFHGNTLYFVADSAVAENGIARPQVVATFEVAMKAEGICLPPRTPEDERADRVRLIVTYDNDVLKTRIPGRLQTMELERPRGKPGKSSSLKGP